MSQLNRFRQYVPIASIFLNTFGGTVNQILYAENIHISRVQGRYWNGVQRMRQ